MTLRVGHHVRADAAVGGRELGLELCRDGGRLRFGLRELTPGLQPADHRTRSGPRRASWPADRRAIGIHSDSRIGKPNFSGITPITVRWRRWRGWSGRRSTSRRRSARARDRGRAARPDPHPGDRPLAGTRGRRSAGPKRVERRDRQLPGVEPLRPAGLGREIERGEAIGPEFLEPGLPRFPDGEIVHADGLAWLVLGVVGGDQRDHAVGLGKRQPLEQPAVDHAEHGCAEANPEPEREDRHQRQVGYFTSIRTPDRMSVKS